MNHHPLEAAERARRQTQRWLGRAVHLIGDPHAVLVRFVRGLSSSPAADGEIVRPTAADSAGRGDLRRPGGPNSRSTVDGGRSLGHPMQGKAGYESDTTVCGAS